MSFTSLDIDPATTTVTMSVARPDGSPLTSPPNTALSYCFGVDGTTGTPYFDPYPSPGETAPLAYDGSRGVFFLQPGTTPDPHLMMMAREQRSSRVTAPRLAQWRPVRLRSASRSLRARVRRAVEPKIPRAELPQPVSATRQDRDQARIPRTLNVAGALVARDDRASVQRPVTLTLSDAAYRTRKLAQQPITLQPRLAERTIREQARQPVVIDITRQLAERAQREQHAPTVIDLTAAIQARDARSGHVHDRQRATSPFTPAQRDERAQARNTVRTLNPQDAISARHARATARGDHA